MAIWAAVCVCAGLQKAPFSRASDRFSPFQFNPTHSCHQKTTCSPHLMQLKTADKNRYIVVATSCCGSKTKTHCNKPQQNQILLGSVEFHSHRAAAPLISRALMRKVARALRHHVLYICASDNMCVCINER
jgi:uncharacterized protein YbbC (DUF1343 family)